MKLSKIQKAVIYKSSLFYLSHIEKINHIVRTGAYKQAVMVQSTDYQPLAVYHAKANVLQHERSSITTQQLTFHFTIDKHRKQQLPTDAIFEDNTLEKNKSLLNDSKENQRIGASFSLSERGRLVNFWDSVEQVPFHLCARQQNQTRSSIKKADFNEPAKI